MGALTVPEAVSRARAYPHGVISYVGADGYPVSVAAPHASTDGDDLVLGPLPKELLPKRGTQVGVIFSHIRPQPGIGYDERRYVNVWGRADVDGDRLTVVVERATGWDEEEVPFFEYAERTLPEAKAYMGELGARPRLSAWWTFFLTTRLPFLTATIVPVALGGAVAAHHDRFAWG